ncbi:MAG: T9SS type A sorting domain-containing protein [Salibacteraceae bacterium]
MKILSSILILLFFGIIQMTGQHIQMLYEPGGTGYNLSEYQYQSDQVVKSNPTSEKIGTMVLGYSSVLNWHSGTFSLVTDSGMVNINVSNGTVQKRPFPFASINIGGLCMKYDGAEKKIYSLLRDANDNVSVAVYDDKSNTLSETKSINNSVLNFYGFRASSAAFDTKNNEFVLASDTGMCKVNANTGKLTSKEYPFYSRGGFNLSLHYDEEDEAFYGLLSDGNYKISVFEYNFESNSMSNVHPLDSTDLLASNIGSYGDTYDSKNNNIIVQTDTGISVINVLTGIVENRAYPFQKTVSIPSVIMQYDPSLSNSIATEIKPTVQIYPNPASTFLNIKSESNLPMEGKLYNSIGKEVLKFSIDSQSSTIDVSSFENGIYFLELKIGSEVVRKKILVSSD